MKHLKALMIEKLTQLSFCPSRFRVVRQADNTLAYFQVKAHRQVTVSVKSSEIVLFIAYEMFLNTRQNLVDLAR